ncbi:MAG: hypothetical protein CSA62_09070 [Planctomycetota bacterium]|nr:MAG: hypothetical protein CSA62_09070 [Planctomycetota bacterium]
MLLERHSLLLATALLAVFLFGHLIHGQGRTLDDGLRRARAEGMLAWLGGAGDEVLPPRLTEMTGLDREQMRERLVDLSRGDSLFGSFGSTVALFAGRLIAPWIGDPERERWLPYHAGLGLWFLLLFWSTGALATRLLGCRWLGLAAALLLVAQPRVLGLATNNPSDLSAAAATALSVLALARWGEQHSWGRALWICVCLAMTAAIRPQNTAHLLPVLLLGVFLLWRQARRSRATLPWAQLLAAPVLSFAVFIALWPEFWSAPLDGPLQLVRGFLATSERYKQATLWFGELELGPALYPLVYLAFTTPILVLLAFTAGLFRRSEHRVLWWMLLAWLALSLGKHLSGLANHGGIRHFLDAFVPLSVFAAAGISLLARLTPRRWQAPLSASLALLLFVAAALQHPVEACFYNALCGGPRGMAGKLPLEPMGSLMLPLLLELEPQVQQDDILLVAGPKDLVDQLRLPLRHPEQQIVEIPSDPALLQAFEQHAATLLRGRRVWLLEVQARAWGRLDALIEAGILEQRIKLGPEGLPVARALLVRSPAFFPRAHEVYYERQPNAGR